MRAKTLLFACFVAGIFATDLRAETPPAKTLRADRVGSPRRAPAPDAREAELLSLCGEGDASLHVVASQLARGEVSSQDPEAIVHALRLAGAPYVRPRAWTLRGARLDRSVAKAKILGWLASFEDSGERRCGIASAKDEADRDVFAAVVVHAQADLAPIPMRVRPSEWVSVDAHFRKDAAGAKIVVQGPSGGPRPLLTSVSARGARARFRADRPGTWLVQVLLANERGPRPVLEALVFAGMEPPSLPSPEAAPGEEAASMAMAPEDALTEMVNTARKEQGLPALVRDRALDDLARAHALQMRASGLVAHDAGDGMPRDRIENAGVGFREMGENVAKARTVALAHRALWASPSHRGNLVHPRFDRMGVGVVVDTEGSVWVAQLFAGD